MKSQYECMQIVLKNEMPRFKWCIGKKTIAKSLKTCFRAGVAFGALNQEVRKKDER